MVDRLTFKVLKEDSWEHQTRKKRRMEWVWASFPTIPNRLPSREELLRTGFIPSVGTWSISLWECLLRTSSFRQNTWPPSWQLKLLWNKRRLVCINLWEWKPILLLLLMRSEILI